MFHKDSRNWTSLLQEMDFYPSKENRKFTKYEAMIDLILTAHQQPAVIKNIEISIGQLEVTQRQLSDKWKWNLESVNRFLKMLESERKIERKAERYFSIITIGNYYSLMNIKERKAERKIEHPYNNIYINNIFTYFCKKTNQKLSLSEKKVELIKGRLEKFSEDEIKKAVDNRFLSEWHMGNNKQGKVWAKDFLSLFRSDEKIEYALNIEVTTKDEPNAHKTPEQQEAEFNALTATIS